MSVKPHVLIAGLSIVFAVAVVSAAQMQPAAEHESIAYSRTAPSDPVARLQKKIDSGEVTLSFDPDRGYLPALLNQLHIPVSSQGLVFSRTSLQVDRIAPWTPRAVYFNDDVYVGWVQGGPIMEIGSVDPKLGAIFYTLTQTESPRPAFERQGQTCLGCHDSSSATGGVPGFIVRSVYPDRYGYVIWSGKVTTDETPLADRWGGWYVTGTHGDQTHMGNVIAPVLAHEVGNAQQYVARLNVSGQGNVTDLTKRFDTAPYLSRHSDAVALLVLAHQSYVHNLITAANYEARRAAYDEQLAGASKDDRPEAASAKLPLRVQTAAENLVRAMLFVKEAALTEPVNGTSGFAAEFQARGPRDQRGRSLRDFDLKQRLFRYPLSYLVYSESFDALPVPVKQYAYRRFAEVLTGKDQNPSFAHLSPADREALLEIMKDTKKDFAASF